MCDNCDNYNMFISNEFFKFKMKNCCLIQSILQKMNIDKKIIDMNHILIIL